MTFKDHGFLGQDSEKFVEIHRHQFAELFALTKFANQVAHELLSRFLIKLQLQDTVVVSLYLRVVNSFGASFRLMEFGFGHDVGATIRNCVESTIYLKKALSDEKWLERYIKTSEATRLKLIKRIQTDSDFAFLGLDAQELAEERKKVEATLGDEEFKDFNLADLAKDTGLTEIYKLSYGYLSNNFAHSSAKSLEPFLILDDAGKIVGIKHAPQTDNYELFFHKLITCLSIAAAIMVEKFQIGEDLISSLNSRISEFQNSQLQKRKGEN